MQPDDEALKLKNEAIALVGDGNISQAGQLLRDYLNRYPDDVGALSWLAVCLPPKQAIKVLDRVLILQPQAPYVQAWRAHYLLMLAPVSAAVRVASLSTSPYPYSVDSGTPEPKAAESLEPEATLALEVDQTEITTVPSRRFSATASINEESSVPANEESSVPVSEESNAPVSEESNAPVSGESSVTDDSPVSLAELIPDFRPLPNTAVIIPPLPPPAPPQVEPLPLLDPGEWVNRANSEARRSAEFTPEATNQIFSLVEFLNKLSWPDPVKTAEGTFQEESGQRVLYHQGLELARGWAGDPKKLAEAAQLFQQCRPPLGFAGVAEVLVAASYVNERLYNPLGLVYAVFWADRALELDPFNLDALIARSEATVRSKWRLLADITVDRLRLLAPHHPRRYAIDGWYEFLSGNTRRAADLLRLAVEKAITPTEKELCTQMLNLVQPPAPES